MSGLLLPSRAPATGPSAAAEPDDVLWARGVAGGLGAFAILASRHSPAIVGHVRQIGATLDEARDLCQETWLHALRQRQCYVPGRLRSWLHTIARHRFLDAAQRAEAGRIATALLPTPLVGGVGNSAPDGERVSPFPEVHEQARTRSSPAGHAGDEHRFAGVEHGDPSASTGIAAGAPDVPPVRGAAQDALSVAGRDEPRPRSRGWLRIRLCEHLAADRERLLAEVRRRHFLDRWGRHLDGCDDCHARFAASVAEDPGPDLVCAVLAHLGGEGERQVLASEPLLVPPELDLVPSDRRRLAGLGAVVLAAVGTATCWLSAMGWQRGPRPAPWHTELGMQEVRVVDAAGRRVGAVALPDWPHLPRSATHPLRSLVDLDSDGTEDLVLALGSPRDSRAELQVFSLRSSALVLTLRVELGRELRTSERVFGAQYRPSLLEVLEVDGNPATREVCVVARHETEWPARVLCTGAGGVLVDYWHAGEVAAIAAWPNPRGGRTLALGGTSIEHRRASVTLLAVGRTPLVARSRVEPRGPFDLLVDAPPAGELLRMPQIEVGPDAIGPAIVRAIDADPSRRLIDLSVHHGSIGDKLHVDSHLLLDFVRGRAIATTADSLDHLCQRYVRLGRRVDRCGEVVRKADAADDRWLALDDVRLLADLERSWLGSPGIP